MTINYSASRYGDLIHNGNVYHLEERAQLAGERGQRPFYFADAVSDEGERVRVTWAIDDNDLEFDEEAGEWKFSEEVGEDVDEYFHNWNDWDDYAVAA